MREWKVLTHKQLRTKALANAEVKVEYEQLADEFSLLDEFLMRGATVAPNRRLRAFVEKSPQTHLAPMPANLTRPAQTPP